MAVNNLWDTYPGISPVSIYSLKKRNSTYTGPLIRVRDSANAVEQDVGSDANGNLAAFTTTGQPYVTVWYDQMGNDNLVNPNTATQPKILPTGSNKGHPIIDFTTGSAWLRGSDFISPSAHPHDILRPTWFGSYERLNNQFTNQMIAAIGSNPASTANTILFGVGRNVNGQAYSTPNGTPTYWGTPSVPFDTVNFVIDMQEVVTELRMYENSPTSPVSAAAGDIIATNTTSVAMGKFPLNNTLRGYNRISELVIQNGTVSNVDRTNIFDTLSTNYGNTPPSGNYKTTSSLVAGSNNLATSKATSSLVAGSNNLATSKATSSLVAGSNNLSASKVNAGYISAANVGFVKISAVANLIPINVPFTIITTIT